MTDAWRKYRGAPAEGTGVCRFEAIPEPGTLAVSLSGFPVLLARSGDLLRAYVNACPHQFLPLDHKGDRIISADGTVLRCTSHGAGFRLADGEGIEGFGLGCALDAIPVSVDAAGVVVIGGIDDTALGGRHIRTAGQSDPAE
ncbi:MAG: Rieske 2Fe-2S domain-containing protein [Amaricoccus sp.]